MAVELPLEIVDKIIDIVVQDDDPRHSLAKTCSLVSRDFLSICRKHIFGSIILNDTRSRRDSSRLITFPMLQRLLSRNPSLSQYVKNLVYCIKREDLKDGNALLATFKQLTQLRALAFLNENMEHALPWNTLRPFFIHLFGLPTLISLNFVGIKDIGFADLSLCTNLEKLGFTFATFKASGSTSNASLRPRQLSIGRYNSPEFTRIFSAICANGTPCFDFSGISNLSLSVFEIEDYKNTRPLLRMCQQLSSLKMDTGIYSLNDRTDGRYNFDMTGLSDMTALPTLKQLEISTTVYIPWGVLDPYFGFADEIAKVAGKNVLENIIVKVNVMTDIACKPGIEWRRLDEVFGPSGWPNLKQVLVLVTVQNFDVRLGKKADFEAMIKEMSVAQFPKLSSSKTFAFKFSVEQIKVD